MKQGSSTHHIPPGSPGRNRTSGIVLTAFLLCLSFAQGAPEISSISHPTRISKFGRFEATFQVGSTVAENLQWPYDSAPPNGIPSATGISVDGLFSPDNWATVYVQPAFLHESFVDEVRDGKPWHYPTGQYSWKVRFAPNRAGTWAFRLRAHDAGGTVESTPQTFEVAESSSPGFVGVSRTDSRYFEFDNGTPFLGLGYQAAAELTEADFQKMAANGIQFLRMWWTPESIFGSQWNPYYEIRNQYLGYVPRPGVLPFEDEVEGKTSIKMRLDYKPDGNTSWFDACRVIGYWGTPTEVKPNTTYRVEVRYRGFGITGPRDTGHQNYGLVVKTDVAWQNYSRAFDAGTGSAVTGYGGNTPSSWGTITGQWFSGTNNFLPKFFLTLENVLAGQVYIDTISMREDLGGGHFGPEILHKPSMEHQNYFQQHNSHHLDRLVEMAERNGVYLKVVILEKGEVISKKIDFDGNFAQDNDAFFFGRGREVGKVRWLQQAWWRYLQARWGYSPSIHSWELLNEGDPYSDQHYILADEFGKYMHCRVFGRAVGTGDSAKCTYDHPNDHLVTTSFWHSLPAQQVWENPRYPNIDYVDVHAYVSTGWIRDAALESDAAGYHLAYSSASAHSGRFGRFICPPRGQADCPW